MNYREEWLELSLSGNFTEAKELYFNNLFPEVIESFNQRHETLLEGDELLISVLGFSPEPVILTAMAMKPQKHVVVTANEKHDVDKRLTDFLDHDFELIRVKEDSFQSVYATLKQTILMNRYGRIVVDITGGKKSTVAAAAIFAKDYACKIVYVDFSEYIEELRKPMPGSEVLNIVYDQRRDQPEIKIQ